MSVTATRNILIGAVICLVGIEAFGYLVDSVKASVGVSFAPGLQQRYNNNIQDPASSQAQLDAVRNGADPSEVYAPTAAGASAEESTYCRQGKIETPAGVKPSLDGLSYISIELNDLTYIKVMSLSHDYLFQNSYQTVTANPLSTLPKDAEVQLAEALSAPHNCEQWPLYLSAITADGR